MNRLTPEKRKQILHLLVEGNSLRATARIADVALNSVKKYFVQAGQACLKFHNTHVVNLKCKRVQCDEIWSFVYSRHKNTAPEKRGTGVGDVWIWVGMCADSKLIISWLVGNRNTDEAKIFMKDVAARIKGRIQLTTDGYSGYRDAVDDAFKLKVDFAQQIKVYENKSGDRTEDNESDEKKHYRYRESKIAVHSGEPNQKFISTAFIERQNLTMRTNIKRLARKTNAFSKKFENHCYSVALHYVYYNFVRLHKTLNVTPAMSAGITRKFMKLEDMVEIIG